MRVFFLLLFINKKVFLLKVYSVVFICVYVYLFLFFNFVYICLFFNVFSKVFILFLLFIFVNKVKVLEWGVMNIYILLVKDKFDLDGFWIIFLVIL